VIIIPCTLVLVILAQPIVAILLNHANATRRLSVGTVLAVLAAGLPGFTVFQLCVRGLQSMQRAREVFYLYVVQNALTIALAIVLGRRSLADSRRAFRSPTAWPPSSPWPCSRATRCALPR